MLQLKIVLWFVSRYNKLSFTNYLSWVLVSFLVLNVWVLVLGAWVLTTSLVVELGLVGLE